MTPKFSFIIPVYNTAKYLPPCLESLQKQTEKEWEAICIDDGSDDESLRILDDFAAKDCRFRIVRQQHQGQGRCRDLGLGYAQGIYVGYIDSDDYIRKEYVQILCNVFEQKQANVISFNYKRVSEDGARVLWYHNQTEILHALNGVDIDATGWYNIKQMHRFDRLTMASWIRTYRKDYLQKHDVRFGVGRPGQDMVFSMRALLCTERVYHVDKYLYMWRSRDDSSVNAVYDRSDVLDNLRLLQQEIHHQGLSKQWKVSLNDYIKRQIGFAYPYQPDDLKSKFISKCYEILPKTEVYLLINKLTDQNKDQEKFIEKIFSIKNVQKNGVKRKKIKILGINFYLPAYSKFADKCT